MSSIKEIYSFVLTKNRTWRSRNFKALQLRLHRQIFECVLCMCSSQMTQAHANWNMQHWHFQSTERCEGPAINDFQFVMISIVMKHKASSMREHVLTSLLWGIASVGGDVLVSVSFRFFIAENDSVLLLSGATGEAPDCKSAPGCWETVLSQLAWKNKQLRPCADENPQSVIWCKFCHGLIFGILDTVDPICWCTLVGRLSHLIK